MSGRAQRPSLGRLLYDAWIVANYSMNVAVQSWETLDAVDRVCWQRTAELAKWGRVCAEVEADGEA